MADLAISTMGRTVGSTDREPRTRRKMTDTEKAEAKNRRQRERTTKKGMQQGILAFLNNGAASEKHARATNPATNEPQGTVNLANPDHSTGNNSGNNSAKTPEETERDEVYIAPVGLARGEFFADESDCDDSNNDSIEEGIFADDDLEDEINNEETTAGPMREYLKAVHNRLQVELNGRQGQLVDPWLLRFLKSNDWTIMTTQAKFICCKLGLSFGEPAYYRKIIIWLPDIRFQENPPCPNGCGQQSCHFHCWRENHYGRLIVDFYGHYFVISRRYICMNCKSEADQANKMNQKVEELSQKAQENGVTIDIQQRLEVPSYTFMAWNMRSVELLPDGLGDYFPAFLTYKAGVDLSVIDFMRPLFSIGIRAEQFRDLMLELATKRHHREWKKREQIIARRKRQGSVDQVGNSTMFGQFGDKYTYGGYVPSANYFGFVFKRYMKSIKPHLDTEVKKRGARFLRWDVSYKEAKKLCRYRGASVFKGLVTATNELGEMRMQFHVVTDGHDQMVNALAEFRNTVLQYGQEMPQITFTDKPSDDYAFFRTHLNSLVESEDSVNAKYSKTLNFPTGIPSCEIDLDELQYLEHADEIDTVIFSMIKHLKENRNSCCQVLGLDEEHEYGSKIEYPPNGRDKIGVLQLAYEHSPGNFRAIVIKCYHFDKLPNSLLELFQDSDFSYTGSRVKGDIARIGEDFACTNITAMMQFHELAHMAKDRGVIDDARTGLKKLVLLTLNEDMSKDDSVRSSKWSREKLTDEQKMYAALDAIKSLEVYKRLSGMVCYSNRLTSAEATNGAKVDIIAPRGKVGSEGMGVIAAVGTVVDGNVADLPQELQIRKVSMRHPTRIVEISKVFAPSLIIPGYKIDVERAGTSTGSKSQKKKRQNVVLGDFKLNLPFRLELPLTMLKHHNPSVDQRLSIPMPRVEANRGGAVSEKNPPIWSLRRESEDDGMLKESESFAAELTTTEMAEIRLCMAVAEEQRAESDLGGKLDAPPSRIVDIFHSVLGDPWHYIDRPDVPVNHEIKKSYYVAFTEAWFAWNPTYLERVKTAMRQSGISDDEITAKMYYNIDFFVACCPRVVLPPSKLYWRVRAVFATYGIKVDSKSKKPLFNDRAWKKANNILKEILKGYASDPPGVPMYIERVDRNGDTKQNKYGLPLFFCLRGTGLTEAVHKQMLQSIGSSSMGIEMSDCVHLEHRHRYNHRVAERKRPCFPLIGHYDTWLVDAIQILVEHNHNVLVYATWSNGQDWAETPETFGTIPLQMGELTNAIRALTIAPTLTPEQKYLAAQQGVPVPFTPLVYREEKALFRKLVLENQEYLKDMDALALRFVKGVDGKKIFPKLAVYLRNYRETYLQNCHRENAVKGIDAEVRRLKEFNKQTSPETAFDLPTDNDDDHDHSPDNGVADNNDRNDAAAEMPCEPHWPEPIQAPPLPLAPRVNTNVPIAARPASIVGGMQIGLVAPTASKRKRGERGKDKNQRKEKSCKRCKKWNGNNAYQCNGKISRWGGAKACQYFEEDGTEKAEH